MPDRRSVGCREMQITVKRCRGYAPTVSKMAIS
jgi:hypothetical protein